MNNVAEEHTESPATGSGVPAIAIEGLSKAYPLTRGYRDMLTFWRRKYVNALEEVNLQIPSKGVFGILGPNGAGKTTLLKILAGLVLPDNGWVLLNGIDVIKNPKVLRKLLIYVSGEERSLYWRLTGRENLKMYAVLCEVPRKEVDRRVDGILDLVGLRDSGDEMLVRYSSGMRQRLCIARGLLADPQILLLDEPTKSLDPVGARHLWNFIREELVGKYEKTIILATHNMEEATTLCDRVAILSKGHVKTCNTVTGIVKAIEGNARYRLTVGDPVYEKIDLLGQLPGVLSVGALVPSGHHEVSLECVIDEPAVHVPNIIDFLHGSGAKVIEIKRVEVSLGDVIAAMAEESR